MIMTGQTNFLQALGWAVLNSLWQLALLWVIYQVLTAIFKTARPAAKASLAGFMLIAGFAWFIYTFLLVYSTHDTVTLITGGMLHAEGDTEVAGGLKSVLPVASVCYLFLLVFRVLRFIRNYRYVQVIRSYGLSKIDAEWRLFVNSTAERMGIRKPVHIWLSEWVTSPVTIGWLKPVILVPVAAINNLSTQQMEAVLLHELSHIRRYDYLLNLVISFIRVVLYFNPFVKAFIKIVETERERSCDEMVLQFQYNPHEYASALLTLEQVSRSQRLLMLGAAGSGKNLLLRIESIMGVQQKQKFSLQRAGFLLASVVMILVINSVISLSKVPGRAMRAADQPLAMSFSRYEPFYSSAPEINTATTGNTSRQDATLESKALAESKEAENSLPAIMHAGYQLPRPVVVLDENQEALVKETVESSKKVLEGTQWKLIEKNLAEVFSETEKNELKRVFDKEISQFDWNKWEYKLRQAYDNVNWEKVNAQLDAALNKLRTDSLVKVYNTAAANMALAQKELRAQSLTGIPDSDITLKDLAEKQRQLQRQVQYLKSSLRKKIVHL